MPIKQLTTDVAGQVGLYPRRVKMITTDSLATITAPGYLDYTSNNSGRPIYTTDILDVWYDWESDTAPGTYIQLLPVISEGVITLTVPFNDIFYTEITLTAAALATAGEVTIQAAIPGAQFRVRDIRVNYSAAGLSGGGGDRLVSITDGTTVYNNAGITAALLGTPVNTVWGGSGNPLPGTIAMNTPTVAGAKLYAVYSGGTTDFSTGSVTISVALERVA